MGKLQRTRLLEPAVLLCDGSGEVRRGRVRRELGDERGRCLLGRCSGIEALEGVLSGGFDGVGLRGQKSSPGLRLGLDESAAA